VPGRTVRKMIAGAVFSHPVIIQLFARFQVGLSANRTIRTVAKWRSIPISPYFMEVSVRAGYARSTGITPISRYRSLPLRWGHADFARRPAVPFARGARLGLARRLRKIL
jgi:hypothetical protein